jgi:D-alanyl-D-alanine carboxypeptidase
MSQDPFKLRYRPAGLFLAASLIPVCLAAGFAALGSQDQRRTVATGAAGDTARPGPSVPVIDPVFSLAAARNSEFMTGLVWPFGSKQQKGWKIYLPLICQTIGSDTKAGDLEFAEAISKWQQRNGLTANGQLDNDTWGTMIGSFQSNRIKNRAYASPENLLEAPAGDFYDPSRPDWLRMVDKQTYGAYKRMVQAAVRDHVAGVTLSPTGEPSPAEGFLKIISAFRPRQYQDQLRKQSPHSDRAGLAVNSPHFTGKALDVYVGGDPVDTRDSNRQLQTATPAYQWLVKNAGRFGFRPYFYEPWHWEYVGGKM